MTKSPDMSLDRCQWCTGFDEYINYHDQEWGRPVHDDAVHFEFLILEGAQAGLSWSTILKRRSAYKKAFKNFDVKNVARLTDDYLENLLTSDSGIVRNRAKVYATRVNAVRFIEVQKEWGSFDAYIWSFVGNTVVDNKPIAMQHIPSTSPESDALSKDLKKRGFKFIGSTIIYAHMQACGLVNDHVMSCWTRNPKKKSL